MRQQERIPLTLSKRWTKSAARRKNSPKGIAGYTIIQAYNATTPSATPRSRHLALLEPGTSAVAKQPAAPSASSVGRGLNLPASFGSLSVSAGQRSTVCADELPHPFERSPFERSPPSLFEIRPDPRRPSPYTFASGVQDRPA